MSLLMLVIGNGLVLTTAPTLSVTKAFTCNYCSELKSWYNPIYIQIICNERWAVPD